MPDVDKPTSWHPTKVCLKQTSLHSTNLFEPEARGVLNDTDNM